MEATKAVAWYVAAISGNLTTPIPVDPAQRETHDGIPVHIDSMTPEPSWPDLILPIDRDSLLDPSWAGSSTPFIGSGSSPARVHRLFSPLQEDLNALLRDEAVVAFLKARLHVDLALYPEYRGGLVLIAPDPVAREVRMFVRARPEENGVREDIVVHVLPRAGAKLSGLELTLIEMRAGGLHRFERTALPEDGLIAWQNRHEAGMSGFILTHETQGVLRYRAPTAFLRRISLQSGFATRRVSIQTRISESPAAREETYDVTEYSRDRVIGVGSKLGERDNLARLYEAEERRQQLAAAEKQGQRWLDDRDTARVTIRRIVSGAYRRVWIADPYLGGHQIFQFIHSVERLGVEIRLITSRLAFEGLDQFEDDDGAGSGNLDRQAIFAHGLQSLQERGFGNVEAWVLRGKSPPLHDRFLVVDDAVWFSGNSFNALGARAGLIMKVPDPKAIIDRLTALGRNALPFDDYLRGRARAKTAVERQLPAAPDIETEL